MKRYALLVALLVMLLGTEARAVNIEFDVPNGVYSGHIDNDDPLASFRISTANNWLAAGEAIGNPKPQDGQAQILVDSITVGEKDKLVEHQFTSVDLSSNSGTTTFIINGKDDVSGNAKNVFAFSVSLTNTSVRLMFDPTAHGPCTFNLDCQIQRLFIAVAPSSTSLYKIDNVCMSGGECSTLSFPNDPNSEPVIVPNVTPPAVLVNVPEPASLLLLGAGLAGIGIWRRKAAR